jgi:hypothetical protein
MAPFYTIRPAKATGSIRGGFQTLDSTKQRKWHGVCSFVFMKKSLISAALAALALSAAAAGAFAQASATATANAKANTNVTVNADIERRGNQIRREQQELRKKTMAAQKRINEEARLHSLHSRAGVDVSGSASTSTEGSAISR